MGHSTQGSFAPRSFCLNNEHGLCTANPLESEARGLYHPRLEEKIRAAGLRNHQSPFFDRFT